MVNEEYNPTMSDSEVNMSDENIFYPASKQNVSGIRNFIAPDSSFINVNGADNNVASGCRYVNIQGSSGCTVQAGLNNISIVNSSGITAAISNQMFLNNRLVGVDDYVFIETDYNLVNTDTNIELVANTNKTATILDGIFTRGKRLRFVNSGSATLTVSVESGIIGNSGAATTVDVLTHEALSIIFNGTNWRILYNG